MTIQHLKTGLLFLSIACFVACRNKDEKFLTTPTKASDSIYYAQGFLLETHADYTLLSIINPWHRSKILQRYVLAPKDADLSPHLPQGVVVRIPLDRTVAFSAVVCGMMNELGVLSSLQGVAEPQYVAIPAVQEAVRAEKIQDIGRASQPNIEQLILIEPEMLFSNPVNETGTENFNGVSSPTLPCLEWMESHPLGQAEWIRVFGRLFGLAEKSDSLFHATVSAYNQLKDKATQAVQRPTVLMEKKYGDIWYMPGGKSYFAHLLADAGADYLFRDNDESGSVPYSFETVLERAEQADFWLFRYYSPQPLDYQQLAREYANYTLFDAYRRHKIFVCNTLSKANYYSELPLHPDWLLADLIAIFHPELTPQYQKKYYVEL